MKINSGQRLGFQFNISIIRLPLAALVLILAILFDSTVHSVDTFTYSITYLRCNRSRHSASSRRRILFEC